MEAVWNASLGLFFYINSSPADMHAVTLFPSLFSGSFGSFEVVGCPVVFKKVRKDSPTVPSKTGSGINVCYHLSLLLHVNTTGVTVLTPHHLNPCRSCIVSSCANTHQNARVAGQTFKAALYTTCVSIVWDTYCPTAGTQRQIKESCW